MTCEAQDKIIPASTRETKSDSYLTRKLHEIGLKASRRSQYVISTNFTWTSTALITNPPSEWLKWEEYKTKIPNFEEAKYDEVLAQWGIPHEVSSEGNWVYFFADHSKEEQSVAYFSFRICYRGGELLGTSGWKSSKRGSSSGLETLPSSWYSHCGSHGEEYMPKLIPHANDQAE